MISRIDKLAGRLADRPTNGLAKRLAKRLASRLASALFVPLVLVASASHAQSAVDERAIIEAASELDRALDDKNWERVRALLLDEVDVQRPGSEASLISAEALVESWREHLHADKTSFHLRGGEVVIFDGADSAVLHSKAHVRLRVTDVPGDDDYAASRVYLQELDRGEDGGWRVRRFMFETRMEDGNPAVLHHRLPGETTASDSESDAGATTTEASPGGPTSSPERVDTPADGDDDASMTTSSTD